MSPISKRAAKAAVGVGLLGLLAGFLYCILMPKDASQPMNTPLDIRKKKEEYTTLPDKEDE